MSEGERAELTELLTPPPPWPPAPWGPAAAAAAC